ncbi:MAG: hypothetical protein GY716_04950 [bacterium]|nr:hypothetical protein [bacterium]
MRIAILLLSLLAALPTAGEVSRAELAGESLSGYPFFHHVRNFNPDEPIQVAVDPGRLPQLVGQTCDLYVVRSKSDIGWTLDPSLVDARQSGAQAVTIGGANIQANTVTAAAAGELSADAGVGLGVGYDVVLDCNQNGALDDGDAIDGRGDEPGLYAVHDTTLPGPLPVVTADYDDALWLAGRVYYPATIAGLGRLPLVVVSHGWTHIFEYYDHIGEYLASWGYVVLTHRNNVGNGDGAATLTASSTTLSNTEYLLQSLDTIGGGALNGHVDSHRIAFIGHSTGGEAVVRAYTRLKTNDVVTNEYSTEDVRLVVSMAPVAFHTIDIIDPFDVNYMVFLGAADTDTANAPTANYQQPLTIFERSTGNRQLIYMHGVGHEWLHNGDTSPLVFGPDLIGRDATHTILRGYYLPVMELYLKENLAGREFFTRSYTDYHPPGIDPDVIVANEFREAAIAERIVIDDYETETATTVSSSGGAVTFDVSNVEDVLLRDLDGSFDWTGAQPSNGMTRSRYDGDDTRGVVFDWNSGTNHYELEVPADRRDFSGAGFLAFRAAQGTRHPRTDDHNSPMEFTLTLRDGAGVSSSILFGEYGTLTRPYRRTGNGTGAGWGNEFNTIRIRVEDFTHNGSGLDLTDVVAVRFETGVGLGAKQGRVGLDDVEVVEAASAPTFALELSHDGATTVTWPAAVDALRYSVYRGTQPAGGLSARGPGTAAYDHTCFEAADEFGDGSRTTTDGDPIPAGSAGYYYLVAPVRSAGEDSPGLATVDLDPGTPGLQLGRPTPTACP